jgi:hypothetical protein
MERRRKTNRNLKSIDAGRYDRLLEFFSKAWSHDGCWTAKSTKRVDLVAVKKWDLLSSEFASVGLVVCIWPQIQKVM